MTLTSDFYVVIMTVFIRYICKTFTAPFAYDIVFIPCCYRLRLVSISRRSHASDRQLKRFTLRKGLRFRDDAGLVSTYFACSSTSFVRSSKSFVTSSSTTSLDLGRRPPARMHSCRDSCRRSSAEVNCRAVPGPNVDPSAVRRLSEAHWMRAGRRQAS